MSAGFNMDDYVDVAERIHSFYERFPDGRLTTGSKPKVVEVGGKPYIWYHARAYRTPDDPLPGDGWAAEPVPGPTQFTKDSELMNAETAAWGRAIVALGFSTKKIASRQEVRNRGGAKPEPQPAEPVPPSPQQVPSPAKETEEEREARWTTHWDAANQKDLTEKIGGLSADDARLCLVIESGREMRGKGKPRKTLLVALSKRISDLEGEAGTDRPDASNGSAEPSEALLHLKAAVAFIAEQPTIVPDPKAWTVTGLLTGLMNSGAGEYGSLEEVPERWLVSVYGAVPDPVRHSISLMGPENLAVLAGQAK